MKRNDIDKNVAELKSYMGKWRGKYLRNFRLYVYSMGVSLDQIKDGNVIGYWNMINSEYTSSISENVIQSAIDSLTSQLASKNAIPFFGTIDGTFAQQQLAKQVEQYFAGLYDEENVTTTVTEAFRDACIFGTGFVYIDALTKRIEKALPWQVHLCPAELTYGKPTKCYYERKQYPVTLLKIPYKGNADYVNYSEYYDIKNNIKAYYINDVLVKVEDYYSSVLPFISISYVNPVYGKDTTSVVDILYGIQMKLQDCYDTISEAIRRNPAQVFVVPQGSDIKTTKLNNRIGQILTYKPIEGVTNPVTPVTPQFVADQYLQMVRELKDDAYQLVGISKLSSQSVKPSGVDSGRAMKTLADIESERFEVQYKAVLRMYTDIARTFIKLMNPDDLVFPVDRNRLSIKWRDVQEIYDKMKVQFSSISMLSRDPTQRAQEIDMLVQRRAIPQNRAAMFFEMPDTEAAYSYANASMNAVMAVINQAVTNEDYTIPAYIPLDLLMNEITTNMLSLKAVENDENIVSLERLQVLYTEAKKMSDAMNSKQSEANAQQDEQNFNQNLAREVNTIYQTTLAQAQANAQVGDVVNG